MGIEHGEPAAVEEFRSTVLARQTEAEEAFVTDGDPGPRMLHRYSYRKWGDRNLPP